MFPARDARAAPASRRCRTTERLPVARGVLAKKEVCERSDILAAIAQRRELDLDRVEAKEKILAKAPRLDLGVQIDVRGREHAHVHLTRARIADALHLAGLQHAQELRLLMQREISDLVQEECSAIGELEAAHAIGLRIRERSLHVSKELALEYPFGQPAHVHGDEGVVATRRDRVQPARGELLPRSVLAPDQHVRIRGANARHELEHRAHARRIGDDLRRTLAAQDLVLPLESHRPPQRARQLELRVYRGEEPCVVPRLLNVVPRPATHRLDRAVHTPPRRHHDHGHRVVGRLQARKDVEPFHAGGRVARVVEIHEHGIERARLDRAQNLRHRACDLDLEAAPLEHEAQCLEHIGLIVGNENARRTLLSAIAVGCDHESFTPRKPAHAATPLAA